MDPIQGTNAIFSINTSAGWVPFVCASDVNISFDADTVSIRTVGDGQWKKYDYQALGYAIDLSGVLVFNQAPDFQSFDMINNQVGFLSLNFQLVWTDDLGNAMGMQGVVIVKSSKLSGTVGQVVKSSFSLMGSGSALIFTGSSPCPTTIDSITVSGASGASGTISVTYAYTGDLYQVKYQIDGSGAWSYAQGAAAIPVVGLGIGQHSIKIIPICSNNYEGTGLTQAFVITQALTCTTVISAIAVNLTNLTATPTYTGPATQMQYSIDGGAFVTVPITQAVSLKNLIVGTHTINMVPLCSVNGALLPGTGFTQTFTIVSQPALSKLNFLYTLMQSGYGASYFNIYVNNILTVPTSAASGGGTVYVPVGSTVRCQASASGANGHNPNPLFPPVQLKVQVELKVADKTLNEAIITDLITHGANPSLTFTFTPNGDEYDVYMTSSLYTGI